MRRGRSTGTPTKEESARIVAAKEGPCMACLVGVEIGLIATEHMVVGCDYNHFKSGNIRRGHKDGCALCLWHHHGSQQLHALGMGDPVVLIECAERRQLSYFPIRKDALLVPVQKFGAALD